MSQYKCSSAQGLWGWLKNAGRRVLYKQMIKSNFMTASVTPTSRACSRCGLIFTPSGKEYTCTHCAKDLGGEPLRFRPHLSPRETQLVQLVQQAKTNKEIAAELQLTPGTAKQYMHALFRKLGIRNRTELAMWGSGYLEA